MSEPVITAPEAVRPGLEKLQQLTEADFDAVISRLGEVQPSSDLRTMTDQLVSQIDRNGEKGVQEIVEAAITFFSGSSSLGLTQEEFIDALMRGYGAKLSKAKRETLRLRIASLMASETLFVAAKAVDLLVAQPNALVGARIFTDLRPVFRDDPSHPPAAALVIHQLRLSYHNITDHQEFFVTVDADDLRMLKKAIERAEAKAVSLMQVAHAAHLRVVDEGDK